MARVSDGLQASEKRGGCEVKSDDDDDDDEVKSPVQRHDDACREMND